MYVLRASGWPRLAQPPWRLLRCGGSVTPGKQLVDPGDLVVGDPAENVAQPSLRIDAIEFCRLDQGVGDRRRFAAAAAAGAAS